MPTDASSTIHRFFEQACSEFSHVIYIMGNHEHYHYNFKNTLDTLRQHLGYLSNLHILEKETVDIGGYTFIGGTLWTDMNSGNPGTKAIIKELMNDFRVVSDYYDDVPYTQRWRYKLTPDKAEQEHDHMMAYIDTVTRNDRQAKYVVVGHHAPSFKSVAEQYKHETVMNHGFASDLEDFIAYRPEIRLWVHGHMHNASDYTIGTTRVVCNPRGYIGYEAAAEDFRLKFIDLT